MQMIEQEKLVGISDVKENKNNVLNEYFVEF